MTRTIFILLFALACACGDNSQTAERSPQTAPTMAAEPVEQAPANMSVRSGPAKVPAATEVEWRNALAEARAQAEAAQGGGGGMRHEDHPFVDFIEDRTRQMSPDQAASLVKGMLNAGLRAPSDDPCARVMAMIEQMGAPLSTEERREIERECEREPNSLRGCLKPEDERTPYERRACRRFLTAPREDLPDVFGTDGAALRGRGGPVREDGPVRTEGPVPAN